MSAGAPRLYPQKGETRFFTFDSGNANEDAYHRGLFFSGPVREWTEARKSRFGEHVTPAHMYITNWETPEEHRVAWVYHAGVQGVNELESFASYHVVCDCAAEHEDSAFPADTLHCSELHSTLADRAEFWRRQYSLTEALGVLATKESEEKKELALISVDEQELLMKSMLGLLDMDRRHPQKWLGNSMSGRIEVETIARLTGLSEEVVELFIEMLKFGGQVESDGQTVRLPEKHPEKPEKPTSISYASYQEAMGIGKAGLAARRLRIASRRVQRKIFGTRKY